MTSGIPKEWCIGDKVGNLVIAGIDDRNKKKIYNCQCSCGNFISMDAGHLNGNYKKNCGCIKGKTSFNDLTGQRFGQLVVIKLTNQRNNQKYKTTEWVCQCDCGEVVIRKAATLRRGASVTCKISGQHSKIGVGEAAFNSFYSATRSNAKKRNLEFTITKEQSKIISKMNCAYCGNPPSHVKHRKGMIGEYVYNGFDRVDNSIGYTFENIVPCCGSCNAAKSNKPINEFKDMIIQIYENWASK